MQLSGPAQQWPSAGPGHSLQLDEHRSIKYASAKQLPKPPLAQQPVRPSLTLDSPVPLACPKRQRDWAAKRAIRRMSRRNGGSSGRKATAHSRTAFRITRPLQLALGPLISKECGRGSRVRPITGQGRFRQPTQVPHGGSFQQTTVGIRPVAGLRYHLRPGTLSRYRHAWLLSSSAGEMPGCCWC